MDPEQQQIEAGKLKYEMMQIITCMEEQKHLLQYIGKKVMLELFIGE